MVPVRALSDGEELARTYASSDKPGELKVPVNGSHTDRIVVFQYQENGVWKNFDRGMQPGYSITSATVTPAGDIPGSGGRYTVTPQRSSSRGGRRDPCVRGRLDHCCG